MKTLEEETAHLKKELLIQDALSTNLWARIAQTDRIVATLQFENASLRNDVNFQEQFMIQIARIVGQPPEQNMEALAKWIKEHWKL